jgi:hypothetical protein
VLSASAALDFAVSRLSARMPTGEYPDLSSDVRSSSSERLRSPPSSARIARQPFSFARFSAASIAEVQIVRRPGTFGIIDVIQI